MSELRYSILFDGQLMPGFDLDTVKANLVELFKSDIQRINSLFSGAPITLKRELNLEQAQRYEQMLQQAGANVRKKPQEQPLSLSLVEVDPPQESKLGTAPVLISCPKCQHEQAKASECSACGIIFEKYLSRQAMHASAASVISPAHSPYAPPKASVINDNSEYGPLKLLSLHGRLGRLRYFGWATLNMLMCMLAILITATLTQSPSSVTLTSYIAVLAMLIVNIFIGVQRLHDIGWSGWLWLLHCVPFLGNIFALVILLMPGSAGRNQYGPPPPPNSPALTWFCVAVFVLLALSILATIMVGTSLMSTASGLPAPTPQA